MEITKLLSPICIILLLQVSLKVSAWTSIIDKIPLPASDIKDIKDNKAFEYTTSALTQYTSIPERDAVLDRLQKEWLRVLDPYRPSDVKLTFISDDNQGDNGGGNLAMITYRLTGSTQKSVDLSELDQQLLKDWDANPIQGIFVDPAQISMAPEAQAPQSVFPVNFTSNIYLTYKTEGERCALLSQLEPLWERVLNQYYVNNVRISFVNVIPLMDIGVGNVQVQYRVDADGSSSGDQNRIMSMLSKTLYDKFVLEVQNLGNSKISFEPAAISWASANVYRLPSPTALPKTSALINGGPVYSTRIPSLGLPGKPASSEVSYILGTSANQVSSSSGSSASIKEIPSYTKTQSSSASASGFRGGFSSFRWGRPAAPSTTTTTTTTTTPTIPPELNAPADIYEVPVTTEPLVITEAPRTPAPWIARPPVPVVATPPRLRQTFVDFARLNAFVIPDQVRISVNSDQEVKDFMDQVDMAWQSAIGNRADFVQVVLYRDGRLGEGDTVTHDLEYVVIIFSSQSSVDLQAFKRDYERNKPQAWVQEGFNTSPTNLASGSYFTVVPDTIADSLVAGSQGDFIHSLKLLWSQSLGQDVRTIIIPFPSSSPGQFSYVTLLISQRQISQSDADAQFHAYLIRSTLSCTITTTAL